MTIEVECMKCKKRFYVEDLNVPDNALEGEAFRNNCPFCGGLQYVTLAKQY